MSVLPTIRHALRAALIAAAALPALAAVAKESPDAPPTRAPDSAGPAQDAQPGAPDFAEVSATTEHPSENDLDGVLAATERAHLAVCDALAGLQSKIPELAAAHRTLNELMKKGGKQQTTAFKEHFRVFPQAFVMMLESRDLLFEGKNRDRLIIAEAKLRSSVQKAINLCRSTAPSRCFDEKSRTVVASERCMRAFVPCSTYRASGGALFKETLEADLTVSRVEVRSVSDMASEPVDEKQFLNESKESPHAPHFVPDPGFVSEPVDEKQFLNESKESPLLVEFFASHIGMCRLRAIAGQEFAPRDFYRVVERVPDWQYPRAIYQVEELPQYCGLEAPIAKVLPRVDELRREYPDSFEISSWHKALQQQGVKCREAAQTFCQQAFVLKDTLVLAYPTLGCEIRRVTSGDLRSDLEQWEAAGISEADRLAHSTMLDLLTACASVYRAGVTWTYVPPNVPKGCKPGKRSE